MKKVVPVLSERERKRQRRAIWECFNGCDCPPDARRDERCTRDAIRCNGRLKVVQHRMAERGLNEPRTNAARNK